MRKILMSALLIMGVGSFAHAVQDGKGSERPAMWRSTTVAHAMDIVLLSTGEIHIHAIHVGSATVNQSVNSYLAIYNSSTTKWGDNSTLFTATGAYTSTNVNGAGPDSLEPYIVDGYYSQGAVINKKGNATVTILWDYVNVRDAKEQSHIVPYKP